MYYKDSKCEKCDLNIFCWNCPAVFENAKEYNEIPIWCDVMKSNISKIIWGEGGANMNFNIIVNSKCNFKYQYCYERNNKIYKK